MLLVGLQVGCAGHSVKYEAFVKHHLPATDHAVSISGSFDEARAFFEKARLPHNSPRQKYELRLAALGKLTAQLGSPDYLLIGEVYGGGNARASQETLTQALCKKAAKKGGDVVMIFRRATVEQPFVYTTPGYSTTNASVAAYGYGNHARAYGTSHTTYTPGQTYSGIMHKPQANGLVFKHVRGVDADRRTLLNADDESLATALARLEELGNNTTLSWEEARSRWRSVVQAAVTQTHATATHE